MAKIQALKKLTKLSREEKLQITADTIEELYLEGINTMRLTTDKNELLVVHVHSEGVIDDPEPTIEELAKD